jgi:hypothetical protein
MFSQIKMYAMIAGGVLLLSLVGGTYFYVKHLQSENAILTANNLKLEQSVSLQKETIASMERDAAEVGKQIILVNKEFKKARRERNALRDVLAKHDIAYLAYKKPGLVENIINKGTDDVGRCFEILSGAPLTEQEKTATKPSQFNRSCPDIANPNYEAKP